MRKSMFYCMKIKAKARCRDINEMQTITDKPNYIS